MSDFDLDLMAPIGARIVPLYGRLAAGRVALVGEADYDLVMQYRWYVFERVRPCGTLAGPYAYTPISLSDGTTAPTYRMHKLITGWERTDHKDHDGLNNRRSNLREASRQQNAANMRKPLGGTSRFKGVHWRSDQGKWRAMIKVNRQSRSLGDFANEIDAAHAYDAAALATWGDFAHPNFARAKPSAA